MAKCKILLAPVSYPIQKVCGPEFIRMSSIYSRGGTQKAKFKRGDDLTEKFRHFPRTFLYLNRQRVPQTFYLNPEDDECRCKSFVILTRYVDVPDPCEN